MWVLARPVLRSARKDPVRQAIETTTFTHVVFTVNVFIGTACCCGVYVYHYKPVLRFALKQQQCQIGNLLSCFFLKPQGSAPLYAGQQPARYLTVDGNTGLADRLVADVSGLALAIITNRAFVLIDHLGGKKASQPTPSKHPLCRQYAHILLKQFVDMLMPQSHMHVTSTERLHRNP